MRTSWYGYVSTFLTFVLELHHSPVDSPHKGSVMHIIVFFVACLNKLLNNQWLWFEMPWCSCDIPDSKVHGANMGPTWVLSAPDGPHVGPMNLAVRDHFNVSQMPCYICYTTDVCTLWSNTAKHHIHHNKDKCKIQRGSQASYLISPFPCKLSLLGPLYLPSWANFACWDQWFLWGLQYFWLVMPLCFQGPHQVPSFLRPTWGLPGADRTQVGLMLAPWAVLWGSFTNMD